MEPDLPKIWRSTHPAWPNVPVHIGAVHDVFPYEEDGLPGVALAGSWLDYGGQRATVIVFVPMPFLQGLRNMASKLQSPEFQEELAKLQWGPGKMERIEWG